MTSSTAARKLNLKQAAERRKAEERRRHRKLVAAGIVAAVLTLAAVVGILVGSQQTRSQRQGADLVPPGVTAAGGVVVGSPTAPVHVIAYEDPQCPVCARFESGSGSVLAAAVEAGEVSVEYRMRSFLGTESVRAVNALAAAQAAGRFEPLRRLLFEHQPVEHSGGYSTKDLIALGARAGLTDASFTSAVRDMRYAGWVREIDDRASRDGNVGTPELRVDGRVLTSAEIFDPAALLKALQPGG